ncbi:MAG: type I-C CRISPR-associated protein Cas5 [Deltaproteobacteria bacterium]|nr:type I-C CRISPR-associated protein Cas5 [Deltaproteobacteria bacterium]
MKGFCLEVSGPYACFTRPEMKVERVSYDVITPSASRAVYDAILWKPAIRWRVTRIEVLSPIRWISVRRNEVGSVASTRKRHIFIEDDRQQRAGLFLRDVKYRLFAEFEFIPPEKRGKVYNPIPEYLWDVEELEIVRQDEKPAKYAAMFERRARKGQCFNQPYLGCREFAAQVRLVDPKTEPATPLPETRDLGWMLYDMDYSDPSNITPQFFRAELNYGVLDLVNVEVRT